MLVGLGCPRCGEMELCDGVTMCYVCEYEYPRGLDAPPLIAQAIAAPHVCGACDRGQHADCSGWCFCKCEANR